MALRRSSFLGSLAKVGRYFSHQDDYASLGGMLYPCLTLFVGAALLRISLAIL